MTQHSARYVINWLDEEALREQHLTDAEWVNMPEPVTAEPDEE
ncbi:hypothetical protein [Morganella morganii]|nr:hypothetical protein [Morganella morganii]